VSSVFCDIEGVSFNAGNLTGKKITIKFELVGAGELLGGFRGVYRAAVPLIGSSQSMSLLVLSAIFFVIKPETLAFVSMALTLALS
jgi:hypothetical protein